MYRVNTVMKMKELENTIEYGYYCLSSTECKNIIITEGLCGIHPALAVQRVRSKIRNTKGAMRDVLPGLHNISYDIISYYAGELAESIVKAAGNGKGVEIAMGYPEILVIAVN